MVYKPDIKKNNKNGWQGDCVGIFHFYALTMK